MGRGKRALARPRLSPLAAVDTGGLALESEQEKQEKQAAAAPVADEDIAAVPLSAQARSRVLASNLRPQYAAEKPTADVLRYARSHASAVARGQVDGAVNLLREHARFLRRGYPALDTLLESLVKRALKDADKEPGYLLAQEKAYALAQARPVPGEDTAEQVESVRERLVAALRRDPDPFAAAKEEAVRVRVEKLAQVTARSVSSAGPTWLVERWLAPLVLDRFLWRAYGRDYEAMSWPYPEDVAPLLDAALGESSHHKDPQTLLDEHVLPPLVARFWPEVQALVRAEIEERTFSAKWPLKEERLRALADYEEVR